MRPLTARQQQVLSLLALGFSNKEIAAALGVSLAAAREHVCRLIARYRVSSRAGVVGAAAAASELPNHDYIGRPRPNAWCMRTTARSSECAL